MLTPLNESLSCEYFKNPLGLDVRQPRLSWYSTATQRNAKQSAYHIQVTDADTGAALWDTDKVPSAASIHIAYAGAALRSGQRCRWRVRVWDEADATSDWSAPAFWEMGLLDRADWQAQWIAPPQTGDTNEPQPVPMLRREFTLRGQVKRARIYATALGLYELELNGQRVGDALLAPGWTSYDHWLQYQTYDATALLRNSENAIGAWLGDGWFRGHLGFERKRNLFGDQVALLLQLHIAYEDGSTEVIGSDEQWRSSSGPIRSSDLYHGEHYDARAECRGWSEPNFDARAWHAVSAITPTPQRELRAQIAPPVRRQETLAAQRIVHSPKGETIFDFGQNMVGWVRLRVRGAAGTKITLRFAEVLDQQGNLYTENLRFAQCTDSYTLRGDGGDEIWEPRFTFHGFQFVAVDGLPGEPTLDALAGIVVHSEMPLIGEFECNNALINQLQHNIVWGQKGNFVDVPTDCPQRDERLGWTGDAQAFIYTACFNRQVGAFFTKWLRDLGADQKAANGSVPHVVPSVMGRGGGFSPFSPDGAAAWGDAATIIPWALYRNYGDTHLLGQQYDSMKGWVNWVRSRADEDLVWRKGFQFGDWLDFRGSFALKPSPVTNDELVATAFFAHSAALTARAAQALGKADDAAHYAALADQIKAAFNAEFVAANGRIGPNSQTAYVLALQFDLLPTAARPAAAQRLAELIRGANYHLTTGFAGTPFLCHALSRHGQTQVAYELLNQESFPSWLYPVKRGATTIWERWDGIKPDGSFQDATMNSFNHYAYGSVGEWMYRVVAGIETDEAEPGFKHVLIQPQPGGGLTHVRAALASPYGQIVAAWELNAAGFDLRVTIPANTRATVRMPAQAVAQVSESGRAVDGVLVGGNSVELAIGSGEYHFHSSGLTLAQALVGVHHIAGKLDFTLPLGELLGNEKTKQVIVKHLGAEFLEHPSIRFAMVMPLENLARMAPQLLTPEKSQAIQAEFDTLTV